MSFLAILPSKSVRPTGASRRLRPTEYPTFLTKIETQAPTFHNATPWARCRTWATAMNTATIRSQRSSRERAGIQDIGRVCFLTKGQDSDSRLPESRARCSPQRPISSLDATRTALDLPHTLS